MPKSITVTDAQGNVYQPTWPKRAKGLVKHGRAAFVNEHTICLTQPPCITEENAMTANDILQKVFDLSEDTGHVTEAFNVLKQMPDKTENANCGAPPDLAGQAKAEAIKAVALAAETTRQQLLAFYIRVYDDMTGHPALPPNQPPVPPPQRQPPVPAFDPAAMAMKVASEFAASSEDET